jgi:hypothetical protein
LLPTAESVSTEDSGFYANFISDDVANFYFSCLNPVSAIGKTLTIAGAELVWIVIIAGEVLVLIFHCFFSLEWLVVFKKDKKAIA